MSKLKANILTTRPSHRDFTVKVAHSFCVLPKVNSRPHFVDSLTRHRVYSPNKWLVAIVNVT